METLYFKKVDNIGHDPHHELIRLKMFHEVCSGNCVDIQDIESCVSDREYLSKLLWEGSAEEKDTLISTYTRYLYNYLSSAMARKEIAIAYQNRHTSWLVESSDGFKIVKGIIESNKNLIGFVELLRNDICHVNVPKVLLHSGIERGFVIRKDALSTSIAKSRAGATKVESGQKYLANCIGDFVLISRIISQYEATMQEMYYVLFREIEEQQKSYFTEYYTILNAIDLHEQGVE